MHDRESQDFQQRLQSLSRVKQAELEKLSDDELMALEVQTNSSQQSEDSSAMAQTLANYRRALSADSSDSSDAAQLLAIYRETRKRALSACWIWKRFLSLGARKRCRKWLEHQQRMEAQNLRFAKEMIQRTHPDVSFEGDNPDA
jgi:hypothetical protein